jgi:16S rRNA (guanine527-N7)-methyltransferase
MKTIDLLQNGLHELNIAFTDRQITSFVSYLRELQKWNRAYNLTALTSDNDIIIKHFLDSLLYLSFIPEGPVHLADVGTGAGFPGVPLKIIRPEIEMTLIEPSRKKTAFLRSILRHLQLPGIAVLEQRIDSMGNDYKEKFDVIVSRATFTLLEFLARACPSVKQGGILIASKGPRVSEDLKELDTSPYAKEAVNEILTQQLPFSKAKRHLVRLSCTMKR